MANNGNLRIQVPACCATCRNLHTGWGWECTKHPDAPLDRIASEVLGASLMIVTCDDYEAEDGSATQAQVQRIIDSAAKAAE